MASMKSWRCSTKSDCRCSFWLKGSNSVCQIYRPNLVFPFSNLLPPTGCPPLSLNPFTTTTQPVKDSKYMVPQPRHVGSTSLRKEFVQTLWQKWNPRKKNRSCCNMALKNLHRNNRNKSRIFLCKNKAGLHLKKVTILIQNRNKNRGLVILQWTQELNNSCQLSMLLISQEQNMHYLIWCSQLFF